MGEVTLDRLPPGARRALPFASALLLGLLAWQMPVLAERGGIDDGEEVAFSPLDTPSTTVAPPGAETDPEVPASEGTPPPTTRFIPPFSPSAPSSVSPPTTRSAAPSAGPTTTVSPPTTVEQRITGPLRVTKSTWGNNTLARGTPAEEVPEGVLPVELASYIEAKKSYIEVRGTAPTITLALSDQASPPDASDPIVIACEIATPFWNDKTPGASFEDSPPYDAESCVDGVRNEDGSWTFDLSGFGDLHRHPGFALAPVTDGTLGTYSVWYEDTAP